MKSENTGTEWTNKIHLQEWLLLISFLGYAFYLRIVNILTEPSYWNDESHVALFSQSILTTGFPQSPIGVGMGIYQIAFYYITSLSFKLFGVTEFAGRFPSAIAGTILIGIVYYVARKWSGKVAGIISAFLTGFLQIQLAWSTQLRPYIYLQIAGVATLYMLSKSLKTKQLIDRYFIYAALIGAVSFLFHGTGIYFLLFVGLTYFTKCLLLKKYQGILLLIPLGILGIIAIYMTPFWETIFRFFTETLHYRIFLTHHYLWLLAGAAIGAYSLWWIDKKLAILLVASIGIIFVLSIFKINPRYVRYSLPAFPFLYILFGIGMSSILQLMRRKIPNPLGQFALAPILLGLFFFIPFDRGMIITAPQTYYSINADMRENPIVDYKEAFNKIEKIIGSRENAIVMDAWNDRVPWYLPKQNFVFLVRQGYGKIDPFYGEKMVGTIEGFERVKSQYPAGIVIVENWESMTPPKLQDHIRNTLNFEFTQETVPGNEKDGWSISVYSWGL